MCTDGQGQLKSMRKDGQCRTKFMCKDGSYSFNREIKVDPDSTKITRLIIIPIRCNY